MSVKILLSVLNTYLSNTGGMLVQNEFTLQEVIVIPGYRTIVNTVYFSFTLRTSYRLLYDNILKDNSCKTKNRSV